MGYEQRKDEYRQSILGLRLIDDVFMSLFFDGNVAGAEVLVHTILGRSDLEIKDAKTQVELKSVQGRSVRLDIFARDSAGVFYNIEVQRDDDGADIRRAALHSAMLLTNNFKPGKTKMQDFPVIYVIFITENDVLNLSRPLYRIERMLLSDGKDAADRQMDDYEHILYVNGKCRDGDTQLAKLMHDFFCSDPDEMYFDVLAERARFLKEEEEGVEMMCKAFEDFREKTLREWNREVAEKVLKKGWTVEETADLLDIDVEEIRKIAEQSKAEMVCA